MASMNDGQRKAIDQIREIAESSNGAIELLRVIEPKKSNDSAWAEISISCEGFEYADKGLKLRDRERFYLSIPINFPYAAPSIFGPDDRFALREHVTWVSHGVILCIYYSSDHQWQPELGMAGFLYRLIGWLERAAKGELDVNDAPIHPPIINEGRTKEFFIARADTPSFSDVWVGFAELDHISEDRIEIVGWRKQPNLKNRTAVAPAILINSPFVSEFPEFVNTLITFFEARGISKNNLADLFLFHAVYERSSRPIYVVFGVAMRGVVGSQDRRQHLVVWRIDKNIANRLRKLATKYRKLTDQRIEKIVKSGTEAIDQWAKSTDRLSWCKVMEQRPEVTTRRDHASGSSWFLDKSATIWGCGAIGSVAAEYLVRAGIRKLVLVDREKITPGLLSRQNFLDQDIGSCKSEALKARLAQIDPSTEITAKTTDILKIEGNSIDELLIGDVLIDATASSLITHKLENIRDQQSFPAMSIISLGVDNQAKSFLMTLSPIHYSGGPFDLMRKIHIEIAKSSKNKEMIEAFWPSDDQEWFEPEPGCSSPTFVGSAADLAALTGAMVSLAGEVMINNPVNGVAYIGHRPSLDGLNRNTLGFEYPPDLVLDCQDTGYQIHVSPEAKEEMNKEIRRAAKGKGKGKETGGILFGERNDLLKIIWISEASGPPSDSRPSKSEFICGVKGVREQHIKRLRQSKGHVGFVGTWHSHPSTSALPSMIDIKTMNELVSGPGATARKAVLVIIGKAKTEPEISGRVFPSGESS